MSCDPGNALLESVNARHAPGPQNSRGCATSAFKPRCGKEDSRTARKRARRPAEHTVSEPAKRAKAVGLRLTPPRRGLGVLVVQPREFCGLAEVLIEGALCGPQPRLELSSK